MKRLINWLSTPYAIILIVAAITHGFMFFIDGVFGDDWLMYTHRTAGDWDELHAWFMEMGAPVRLLFYWTLGYCPNLLLAYHVVGFASLTGIACFVYRIGTESGFLAKGQSLSVALVTLTYPAMQVAFSSIGLDYAFWLAVFLLAVLLAMRAERSQGPAHLAWRLAALLGFVVSFSLSSLLVFYFGFLCLLVLILFRQNTITLRSAIFRLVFTHADYIVLPFAYRATMKVLFPPHGLYEDYNQIRLSIETFGVSVMYFLRNGVYLQLHESLAGLLQLPVFALLLVLSFLWAYRTRRLSERPFYADRVRPWSILTFGVLLLFLGIVPYAAVYKFPTVTGVCTRHSVLLALPMALILTSGVQLVVPGPNRTISQPGFLGLATLIACFSMAMIGHYVTWETQAVRDHAVMAPLARLPAARQFSVFWIENNIQTTVEPQPWFSWASMFKQVWHEESHIGMDVHAAINDHMTLHDVTTLNHRYNAGDVNVNGRHAILTISPGPAYLRAPKTLALRYLVLKYWRPARLNSWLLDVVDLNIEPTAPLQSPPDNKTNSSAPSLR